MTTLSTKSSKWMRLQEVLVTTLLGNIPPVALGVTWRKLLYSTIFSQFGKDIYIEDGVKIYGTACIKLGDGVKIYSNVRLNALGKNNSLLIGSRAILEHGVDIGFLDNTHIEIGEDTFIGPYTCLAGFGDIKIGKGCLIAAHSGIFANSHIFADPIQQIKDQGITTKGIVIEDNCWLGHNVTVIDGITIGRGSVIGAGAVVNKNIPPYSVAVGVPARVISQRQRIEQIKV